MGPEYPIQCSRQPYKKGDFILSSADKGLGEVELPEVTLGLVRI